MRSCTWSPRTLWSSRSAEAQLINDSNEILSGVHEMKVASEDAWQEGVTANGESYVYNTVTMATRWEKPSTSYRDNPPRWMRRVPTNVLDWWQADVVAARHRGGNISCRGRDSRGGRACSTC